MSTVSPSVSETVRSAASARGVQYIAAPVTGSTVLAGNAQLTVFASGPARGYSAAKPVFDAISSRQYYVGEKEEARYLKLAINHLVGSPAVLLGEALTLARRRYSRCRTKERVCHTVVCMLIAAAGYTTVAVSTNLTTAIAGFIVKLTPV